MRACIFFCVALVGAACGSGGGTSGASSDRTAGAAPGASDGASGWGSEAGAPPDQDAAAPDGCGDTCAAWNVRAHCTKGPNGPAWTKETCRGGCFAGACSATACGDECALGETGPNGTCREWDMKSGAALAADAAGSMHDRARGYDAWLRSKQLPGGAVASAHYADDGLTTIASFDGLADSALWTGTDLAAQAWRATATESADAQARVGALAAKVHELFAVTGMRGYLARFTLPTPTTFPVSFGCGDVNTHCDVPYQGGTWSWKGGTSRDQYTGVMLGLWLAYTASHDEKVRAMIREDVLAVADELMQTRKGVPARLVLDGTASDMTLDLENVILTPSETVDGRILIAIDTSNLGNADITGVREFLTDWSIALRQIPILSFLPPIPRADSALMLGAFFQMAIAMSTGDPRHQVLVDYYDAHADGWLDVAATWSYANTCGAKYYGIHIGYIVAYAWARLEKDPARRAKLDGVLGGKMWALVKTHKNPYFAYLWAGTQGAPDKNATDAASAQLAQFEPGPRVHAPRHVEAKYPQDPSCSTGGKVMSTEAVDVGDRTVSDVIWQRQPWGLADVGDPHEVFPGVDYVAAYWAGRFHEFVPDDRVGTCARWLP